VGDGRYEIARLLGEGSRKRVFLGYDRRLDRQVAIALIETGGLDAATLARVRSEARALGKLGDHPNTVTVHDTGEEPGRIFIVSQLMAGGDVQQYLERFPGRRLPLGDALRIAEQVCRALAHAHRHGIVHRDLKPANVWLDADDTAKLGDFGAALTAERTHPTAPGTVVGTPAYMSPEQALGDRTDARSDLYSLGAMLYEMTTGRPPFVAADAVGVVSQHVNAPPAPPSSLAPSIPPALDDLILALLAKSRDDRPPTAEAVSERLRALMGPAGAGPPTLDSGAAAPRPPARPRHRVAAGLAASLAFGALMAIVARRASVPAPPARLVVGVMAFEAPGATPDVDRIRQSTRDSLNTILSQVEELRVYAKEMIDFKREKLGLREFEVAQELGITKMVSGTISAAGADIALEVRVVDVGSGFLDASILRARPRTQLIELQNEVATEILKSLKVPLSPARLEELFAHRGNQTLDSYNRLYDALGDPVEEEKRPAPPPPPPGGSSLLGIDVAWADEVARDEARIRALLEDYRAAFEARDVDRLASLQVEMTGAQRAALGRYFENARNLAVQLLDLEITVEGDEALATYRRVDTFQDARSGEAMRLEVRLSTLLARRDDGTWRIRGRK
jgi:ketosteroid isomerase-like protein/TolB-like protein